MVSTREAQGSRGGDVSALRRTREHAHVPRHAQGEAESPWEAGWVDGASASPVYSALQEAPAVCLTTLRAQEGGTSDEVRLLGSAGELVERRPPTGD